LELNQQKKNVKESWQAKTPSFLYSKKQNHGGSFGYTSVCHCQGYSHVVRYVNFKEDVVSFSDYSVHLPTFELGEFSSGASQLLSAVPAMVALLAVLL